MLSLHTHSSKCSISGVPIRPDPFPYLYVCIFRLLENPNNTEWKYTVSRSA